MLNQRHQQYVGVAQLSSCSALVVPADLGQYHGETRVHCERSYISTVAVDFLSDMVYYEVTDIHGQPLRHLAADLSLDAGDVDSSLLASIVSSIAASSSRRRFRMMLL